MAFNKRIWLPHEVQYPGRKILLPTGNPNEFDESRSEGIVTAVGDLTSAENLNDLEKRIFDQFGIVPEVAGPFPWTPTIFGGTTAGSPAYISQTGIYYKMGRFVYIRMSLQISSKGGMAGALKIGGLPFVVSAEGALNIAGVTGLNISAGSIMGPGRIVLSEVDLNYASTNAVYGLDASLATDNLTIFGASGSYLAAA